MLLVIVVVVLLVVPLMSLSFHYYHSLTYFYTLPPPLNNVLIETTKPTSQAPFSQLLNEDDVANATLPHSRSHSAAAVPPFGRGDGARDATTDLGL